MHWNGFWGYNSATCLLGCKHRAVAKGPVGACVCISLCFFVVFFFFLYFPVWMDVNVTVSMVANPRRRMLIMGKWERQPERILVMLVIIRQQTGRLCVSGLCLFFTPTAPASCTLSLTIKKSSPRDAGVQVSRRTQRRLTPGSQCQHSFGQEDKWMGQNLFLWHWWALVWSLSRC